MSPLARSLGRAALLSVLALPTLALTSTQGITVDAGPVRFLLPPATSLTLQGTIAGLKHERVPSDVSIAWSQISGPPAQILDPDRLAPTIVPSQPGILRLRLQVQDPNGGVATDDTLVAVFGNQQSAQVGGALRKWDKLTLTFQHDTVLFEAGTPNPFLDFRLVVYFFNAESGALYTVPGFFAADGNAAESSATNGDKWRVNFTPDHAGTWYYLASFRTGSAVAISSFPEAGQPVSFDGASGSVTIAPADPSAPGFLAKGRVEYVGEHQLRCAETHERFLEGGTNSPENFLAYYEFDNTVDLGGNSNGLNTAGSFDGLHHYASHWGDYVDLGVKLWKGGKGRRIFGALNYLASRGVNGLYALTYNIDGGDGEEIWPWSSAFGKLRFDVSKLAQWERVIDHMMRCGISLQLVTQETENDHELDGGSLGTERKLYYRELVARFAHAPALIWNLGEENDNSTAEREAFADYIRALDPYDHPIALHNHVGDLAGFDPLLGNHLELFALQDSPDASVSDTQDLLDDSDENGRPWVIDFDEQNPADEGVVPDAFDFWHDEIRREALWPNLLAGGGGCEWYFGYAHANSDIDCEDFRTRDNMWLLTTRALDFLRANVPFERMSHADGLVSVSGSGAAANVLAQRGEFYLVYLPFGGSALLNLEANGGAYLVSWFDARNGGALVNGSVTQIFGPGTRTLGTPPGAGDWLAFVRRSTNQAPVIESVVVEPQPFTGDQDLAFLVYASDPNGPSDTLTLSLDVTDPSSVPFGTFPLTYRGGNLYSLFLRDRPALEPGLWQLLVNAEDQGGLTATQSASFTSQ